MVLWVKLCSWVARPPRASAISSSTVLGAELAPGRRPARSLDQHRAARARRAVAPSREPAEHLRADVVDQRDPGAGEQLGAEVGVAAGDERRRVHHGHARRASTQRLGGDPVEVEVVDDRDVAGLQTAHGAAAVVRRSTPGATPVTPGQARRRLAVARRPGILMAGAIIVTTARRVREPRQEDATHGGAGSHLSGGSGAGLLRGRRAAPRRAPARCRSPPARPASGTARGPGPRRRARSDPRW